MRIIARVAGIAILLAGVIALALWFRAQEKVRFADGAAVSFTIPSGKSRDRSLASLFFLGVKEASEKVSTECSFANTARSSGDADRYEMTNGTSLKFQPGHWHAECKKTFDTLALLDEVGFDFAVEKGKNTTIPIVFPQRDYRVLDCEKSYPAEGGERVQAASFFGPLRGDMGRLVTVRKGDKASIFSPKLGAVVQDISIRENGLQGEFSDDSKSVTAFFWEGENELDNALLLNSGQVHVRGMDCRSQRF